MHADDDCRRHTTCIGPTDKRFADDVSKEVDRRLSLRSVSRRLSTGPSLVHLMTAGRRVVRGPNWKWGDQVCSHILNVVV